ncbi:MAG: signal recognition particle-docking protein FtsY [Myxococcales bacterium]|nr:signal recognition particle-docking protein FtsY [Myxococcales bacterium]
MDNPVVIAVIVLIVVAIAAFFALNKKKAPELPAPEDEKPEPKKPEPKKAEPAAKKAEPEPTPKKAEPKPEPAKAEPPKAPEGKRELAQTALEAPQAKAKARDEDIAIDEAPAEEAKAVAPPTSKRDVEGLRKGLTASRKGFIARLTALFTGKKEIDPAILEQMEEVMISSDVGVKTTQAILERLREKLERKELDDASAVWGALRAEALRILSAPAEKPPAGRPLVLLMVGVNGVGKTTTIGKLATKWNADGRKVMLAAGDTFRAAAVQQLEVWGKRVGADVIRGKEGADPGAVAFDATTKAKEAGVDVLLVDTAGRLHTKAPLMDEIKKVRKTIAKAMDGAPHETFLVLDATTGQNALTQAQLFKEAVDLTGIVLTKLDGTAKGGIVLGICDELKVPVRYVGLGERAEDLREFHAGDFVEALFGQEAEADA